jgi:hypothetical protein
MATTVTSDTVETFVECPVCNGWYSSLELHLTSWKTVRLSRGYCVADNTLEEDLRHEELFAETFVRIVPKTRSNRKYVSLSEKQRAYWKRRREREELEQKPPSVLPCGHSTIVWNDNVPVCSTCGVEPQ